MIYTLDDLVLNKVPKPLQSVDQQIYIPPGELFAIKPADPVPLILVRMLSDNLRTISCLLTPSRLWLIMEDGHQPDRGYLPGVTRFEPESNEQYVIAKLKSGFLTRNPEFAENSQMGIPALASYPFILFHPGTSLRDTKGCFLVSDGTIKISHNELYSSWTGASAETISMADNIFLTGNSRKLLLFNVDAPFGDLKTINKSLALDFLKKLNVLDDSSTLDRIVLNSITFNL